MIELWIPFTIVGGFFQNLRSALQKHLKSRLSDAGATYVRFFYAWPFAALYLWGVNNFGNATVPSFNAEFLVYCVLGGVAQIVFTFLLIYLFSFRNFAVGTTYSKTEVAQVAILGFLFLGDTLSGVATAAVALCLVGVLVLSAAQTHVTLRTLLSSLTEKATLIGIASGAFLGASVVFYRGAILALEEGDFLIRAAFALAVTTVIQTAVMGVYLRIREPGQLTAVVTSWRVSLSVGVVGVLTSICWFTAFAIQNAAYVRALGQIELVFTFIASAFVFKERTTVLEYLGIGLIIAAILMLVLGG